MLKIKTAPPNDSDIQMSQTETMWRCPRCKLNMTMSEERCKKCSRELQYFENVLNYGLEQMIIEVPIQ